MSYRSASRNHDPQAAVARSGRQDDRHSHAYETRSSGSRDHRQSGEQRGPRDEQAEQHPHRASEPPVRRAPPYPGARAKAPRRAAVRADYTLGHAGRQVRFGPVVFWTIVGTLVIMASWSLVTATYFAFHDDVAKRLIARQSEMRHAYEDRISDLRMRVDRITSRQLLDQTQFEQKLDQLLRRQATIESRAATLNDMADPLVTGSIGKAPHGRLMHVPSRPRAAPIDGTASVPGRSGRAAPLDARGGIESTLARVQDSLDRAEIRQTTALNALESTYDARARRMRGVFADLGLDATKMATHRALGGPFVPVKLAASANGFDRQIYRISIARAQVDRLTRALFSVPIRKPMSGEIDETSRFGVRIDPFLGRPAMHTGVDFRGNVGDPVRATASGMVTHAGWSGGYGLMVEIDHGHGIVTRYGHLSMIEVAVGQKVKADQIVGRVGSTGRSTGPHLHYETRVAGEAINPQKFLQAGALLGRQM